MKRAARVVCVWMAMFLVSSSYALALSPVNLSPASDVGPALVISGCPTFSWSEVEDAVSYQITVFEKGEPSVPLSYGEMSLTKGPVLEQAIVDRGLS